VIPSNGQVYAPAIKAPDEVEILKSQLPERAELERIYKGLGVDISLLYSVPVDDDSMMYDYLTSKLWRMNNLYTIIDKDGERIPFVMNLSQHIVYAAALHWYRVIILKSRQQGISTFWLLCFKDDALFYDNTNIGLMAQGKDEASKLLKRIKLAWHNFDSELKGFLDDIRISTDNKNEIGFSNDSAIYIAVSFRSATLHRLHVSELGKISNEHPERAKELKTGTLQAIKPGHPVILESTADGDNMFKEMWDEAVELSISREGSLGPKDFKPVFLSWMDDTDCLSYVDEKINVEDKKYLDELQEETGVTLSKAQINFWIMQHRELGEYIYQEYPSTPTEAFIAIRDGTYYARLYMRHITLGKREVSGLYDPTLSVQVSLDLGYNDTFVLVYFQKWGKEVRIIDEYFESGYGLDHYIKHMKDTGYNITNIELPHDSTVHELQTGKTREQYLREAGVRNLHLIERSSVDDGIEKVRKMLENTWIDPKCVYIKKCLKGYTKTWDEQHEVWKKKPEHNECSNGADAVRGIPMGLFKDSVKLGRTTLPSTRKANRNVINGVAM
jgi:hypothetical protein